ncbi:hypothetical protein EHF33_18135 (plasmid) [Deinococcus psychrotolerans]|uniref:Uncharacterized protein n=1 Tax=Deinococcus psychrotolerans TaxID=2489213 RepID=A0A3G8YT17_9DEIO|nr:hypothetical protein [Deinococcus psychrotolerans]AZI44841.1 hypothetical protein EHF33_18135 [Deinococcus psychrotolerans]
MTRNRSFLLSALTLSLLAVSCGSGTPQPPLQTLPDPDFTRPEDTTLSPNTRILTPAARTALVSASPDLSILRFKTSPDTAFAPGQILVSQDTPIIPDGMLRRVLSVKVVGNLTEVETDQASLEDAVENGTLMAEEELSLDDIEEQMIDTTGGVEVFINGKPALVPQGLRPQGTKTIGKLELQIKDKVLCQLDGDSKVVMTGSFYADFKVFANAKLKWFKLKHFDAGVEMNEKSTVSLSGECSKTLFKKEVELARFKMRVRTYWIGPLPVVVRPEIVMTAGANGKISAKVDFSATHEFHARYGIKWDKGDGWNTISDRTQSFTYTKPKFSASLDAEGYIGARAGVRFYGLASAFVHPKIFADFGASVTAPQNTYQWKLDAGFRIGVGAEASLFGRQLGKIERDLVEFRKTIASDSGKF